MKDFNKLYLHEAKFLQDAKTFISMQPDCLLVRVEAVTVGGYSDILVCCKGWFVALELKKHDGTATPQQNRFIDNVKKVNGLGGVCYCMRDIVDLLNEARCRSGRTLQGEQN